MVVVVGLICGPGVVATVLGTDYVGYLSAFLVSVAAACRSEWFSTHSTDAAALKDYLVNKLIAKAAQRAVHSSAVAAV